jgi:hypothetical protein
MPNPCDPAGVTDPRALASFELRFNQATLQAKVPIPAHDDNGDEQHYSTRIGTYTKGILQDSPCLVNPAAYQLFKKALASKLNADFEAIPLGGTRTLNGPQGCYAFTMAGTDAYQFGSPLVKAPPALKTKEYGTELVELYWAALLRDVAFTELETNPTAVHAASELSGMPEYQGPRDGGKLTPRVLFRGDFPGETVGPYLSQFLILPAALGEQAISQQLTTYVAGRDYMTELDRFAAVQNGISTGLTSQTDPVAQYLHNGRGLAAYTNVDELFQAYFTAYLVLNKLGVAKNPGNPYKKSHTQNGFGTFGGPDIASTLAYVAKIALNAVWYQKWLVHLRHRPESGGGIVHLIKTNQGGALGGSVNDNVLHSKAVAASYDKYHSYLLSQAFPDGSPTHPAYPTGHGTVGGACITVLKFFFDGSQPIMDPKVSSADGLKLDPYDYTSEHKGSMTVNGELNKLAHNISFGHGIHAGIHWRSDSDISMLLGEAVALSVLQDLAKTYNEQFSIRLQKLDGTTATITNP